MIVVKLLHFLLGVVKCIVVTAIGGSVCLFLSAFLHYCTDADVTLGDGRWCPLIDHCWVVLQSVHGFRC